MMNGINSYVFLLFLSKLNKKEMKFFKKIFLILFVTTSIWSCDKTDDTDITSIESAGFSATVLDTAEIALEGVGVKLYYVPAEFSEEDSYGKLSVAAASDYFYVGDLVDYVVTDSKGRAEFGDVFSGDYYVVIEDVDVNGSKYFVYQYVQIIAGEDKKLDITPSRYVATVNMEMDEQRQVAGNTFTAAAGYTVIAIPYYLTTESMSREEMIEIASATGTTDSEGKVSLTVPANVELDFYYFKNEGASYFYFSDDYFEIGDEVYWSRDIEFNTSDYVFGDGDADETTRVSGINVLYVQNSVLGELFDYYDYYYPKVPFSELINYAAVPVVTSGTDGSARVEVIENNYSVYFYLSENHFYQWQSNTYFSGPDYYSYDSYENSSFEIFSDSVSVTVRDAVETDSTISNVEVALIPYSNFYKYGTGYGLTVDEMLSEAIATATTDADGIAEFAAVPKFYQWYAYLTYDPNDKENWGVDWLYGNETNGTIDLRADNGKMFWYD